MLFTYFNQLRSFSFSKLENYLAARVFTMKICKINQVSSPLKTKQNNTKPNWFYPEPGEMKGSGKYQVTTGYSTVLLYLLVLTEFPATVRREMSSTMNSKEKGRIWRVKCRSRKQPQPRSQPRHDPTLQSHLCKSWANLPLENTAVLGQNWGWEPNV